MILILISVLLNAIAQVFMKFASIKEMNTKALLTNEPLYVAGMLYLVSILLWLKGLSSTPLSKAYPLQSLGYLVVMGASALVFKEIIGFWQIIGIIAICLGIAVLGFAN